MKTCKNHKDRDAVYNCNKCKEQFCGDCIFEIKDIDYCADCSKQIKSESKSGLWSKLVGSLSDIFSHS